MLQGERDAPFLRVHVHDLRLNKLSHFEDLFGVIDASARAELGDRDEAVYTRFEVDECPKTFEADHGPVDHTLRRIFLLGL